MHPKITHRKKSHVVMVPNAKLSLDRGPIPLRAQPGLLQVGQCCCAKRSISLQASAPPYLQPSPPCCPGSLPCMPRGSLGSHSGRFLFVG